MAELLGWRHAANMSSLGQQTTLGAEAQSEKSCWGHMVPTVLVCLG